MLRTIRSVLFMTLLFLAACERTAVEPPEPATHDDYREALAKSALAGTLLGRGWLEAADDAVRAPTLLRLPHHEQGVFLPIEARSIGIAFDAVEGQDLHLTLAVSGDSEGRLFADLYFLDLSGDQARPRNLTSFADLAGGVLPLERSGRYVIRLQPELLASIDYRLHMELDAAVAFPVSGHGLRNIGSVFGDPRDGGRRRHEGIDIFAPRATPVVAVVDGTAVVRHSNLGGNTVWLRGEGKSFYYAHLHGAAIDGRERVDAGDVLGFVGNTGNAVTAPPHLHFGIYRRGRGAVDPLPYVVARTFTAAPQPVAYEPGFAAVTAAELNLRPGPGTDSTALDRLGRDTPVRIVGATDDWLRVRTMGGKTGWIHRRYQAGYGESVPGADRRYRAQRDAWILSAVRTGVPVGRARPRSSLHVFAEVPGWQLVGDSAGEPLGWLRAASAESIAASQEATRATRRRRP